MEESRVRCRGDRQSLTDGIPQSEGKPHVLLGVLEGELGTVGAVHHVRALEAKHHVRHDPEVKDLQQLALGKGRRLCESHAFGEGRQHVAHDHVHHKLHAGPGPHGAKVERGLPHDVQLGPNQREECILATAEEDELPRSGGALAATHRCFEEPATFRLDLGFLLLHSLRRQGSTVNNSLAFSDPCNDLSKDSFRRLQSGQHAEGDIGLGHDLRGGRSHRHKGWIGLEQLLALAGAAVPDYHGPPLLEQIVDHALAHDPESNEPKGCRGGSGGGHGFVTHKNAD
mmetsp:Transcript_6049/g.17655  ORF Transcript_6049/g.17655 Transcript_6049/m.17655 type:complete len:284 (+) Transcript_6049:1209-2060(+)